jgi:hypothetical protein
VKVLKVIRLSLAGHRVGDSIRKSVITNKEMKMAIEKWQPFGNVRDFSGIEKSESR